MQRAGNYGTGNASDRPVSRRAPGLRCAVRRFRTKRTAWASPGTHRVGDRSDGQGHAGITQPGIAGHAHFFGGISVAYHVSLAPASLWTGRTGLSRAGQTLAAIAQ